MTREIKAVVNNMCYLSEVCLSEGRKKGRIEGMGLGLEQGRTGTAGYVMNMMKKHSK